MATQLYTAIYFVCIDFCMLSQYLYYEKVGKYRAALFPADSLPASRTQWKKRVLKSSKSYTFSIALLALAGFVGLNLVGGEAAPAALVSHGRSLKHVQSFSVWRWWWWLRAGVGVAKRFEAETHPLHNLPKSRRRPLQGTRLVASPACCTAPLAFHRL